MPSVYFRLDLLLCFVGEQVGSLFLFSAQLGQTLSHSLGQKCWDNLGKRTLSSRILNWIENIFFICSHPLPPPNNTAKHLVDVYLCPTLKTGKGKVTFHDGREQNLHQGKSNEFTHLGISNEAEIPLLSANRTAEISLVVVKTGKESQLSSGGRPSTSFPGLLFGLKDRCSYVSSAYACTQGV